MNNQENNAQSTASAPNAVTAENIISEISRQKNLEQNHVKQLVLEKQLEYDGLLTETGAAFSIARELGVKLPALEKQKQTTKINELAPGMNGITLKATAVAATQLREFERNGKKGSVTNITLTDETNSRVNFVWWNPEPEQLAKLKQSSTLTVYGAFVKQKNNEIELQLGQQGTVEVAAGLAGNSQASIFSSLESKPQRLKLSALKGSEKNVQVKGVIVEVYKPHVFQACPQCGSSVKDKFCVKCNTSVQQTKPELIVNCELDDGTNVVRAAFFRNRAEKLLNAKATEFEQDPSAFNAKRRELLGVELVLDGDSKLNNEFNRIEFIVKTFNTMDAKQELLFLEQNTQK